MAHGYYLGVEEPLHSGLYLLHFLKELIHILRISNVTQ
jgi:hypothetical protein